MGDLGPQLRAISAGKEVSLDLGGARLSELPPEVFDHPSIEFLNLAYSRLENVPAAIERLPKLKYLYLQSTLLTELPDEIGALGNLRVLDISSTRIERLPDTIGNLRALERLELQNVRLRGLPLGFGHLDALRQCDLSRAILDTELSDARSLGLEGVRTYLRRLEAEGVPLNEVKVVLVGEGDVGKSSLLAALRDEPWVEGRSRTHGVEIKPVRYGADDAADSITLRCWDFGGQTVYRQTHQIFFTSPAVYLVVWKPREGPEQNFVDYWISQIRRRVGDDPNVKIVVVATHRDDDCLPRIDEEMIETKHGAIIAGFKHVSSKTRVGIDEVRSTIGELCAALPQVGRLYPASWLPARELLVDPSEPFLSFSTFADRVAAAGLDRSSVTQFTLHAHQSGQVLYYGDEPALAEIVVLRPDWVSRAMSYVVEDPETVASSGLVAHARLAYLWDDPRRPDDDRYPPGVHPLLLRLMERFDLSYRVAEGVDEDGQSRISLVGQLIPVAAPDLAEWGEPCGAGLRECQEVLAITDTATGHGASPEGLMAQLIVRLHRYSLGRSDFSSAQHWQSGMVLDDGFNGRALLVLVSGNLRIRVRAAYPNFFLRTLMSEISWLVDMYWKGLTTSRLRPCEFDCDTPGQGLFDVDRMFRERAQGREEFPCRTCDRWQNIDRLLLDVAPDPQSSGDLQVVRAEIQRGIRQLSDEVASMFDEHVSILLRQFDDEANAGPRLFTLVPVDKEWRKPQWVVQRFRLTLYCEHSRLPVHALSGGEAGVYELEVGRDWVRRVAPAAKLVAHAVSLALPIAKAALTLDLDDDSWKGIEEEVDLAKESMDALSSVMGDGADRIMAREDVTDASLRRLHAWLTNRDPGFGGLEKVRESQHRALWVHPRFVTIYQPDLPTVELQST